MLTEHDITQDNLYPCLKCNPEIRVLNFEKYRVTAQDCKAIGKVLSDFKNIKELNMSDTYLDNVKSKDIADGLMRAKSL